MKIAIIAWGSLVRRPETLSFIGSFKLTDLQLPIEFCRVSDDGRLTLVVDGAYGAPCPARVAVSGFDALPYAINNLRKRERTTRENIGFVDMRSGQHSARIGRGAPFEMVDVVKSWVADNGYDAAIWTVARAQSAGGGQPDRGLLGGCRDPLSRTLHDPALDYALNHIRDAPAEVRTPVRAAIEARWPLEHPPD